MGSQMITKWQISVWHQLYQRTINNKHFWNVTLDTLMCAPQITNWYWTPITDPSCHKQIFYQPPYQKLLNWPYYMHWSTFSKTKKGLGEYIFYTLMPIYCSEFKTDLLMAINLYWINSTCQKLACNGPAVICSKIQDTSCKAS